MKLKIVIIVLIDLVLLNYTLSYIMNRNIQLRNKQYNSNTVFRKIIHNSYNQIETKTNKYQSILRTPLYLFFNSNLFENKILLRFHEMVKRFSSYSDKDILLLDNERLQVLIKGGMVALNEPKICKAFEILYEDVLPVRLGGDIIFNLLDKTIIQTRAKNNILSNTKKINNTSYSNNTTTMNNTSTMNTNLNEIQLKSKLKKNLINKILTISKSNTITNTTDDYCSITSLFTMIDQNNDGDISKEEFKGWIESIVTTDMEERLGWDPSLEVYLGIYEDIDINKDGILSLDEFKLWTTGVINNDQCNDNLINQNNSLTNTSISIKNNQIIKPSLPLTSSQKQYLYMVKQFSIWGIKWNKIYSKNISINRFDYVIIGCFRGAEIPEVVNALQVLYEDYIPLRIAGDIIFKLVEKTMIRL